MAIRQKGTKWQVDVTVGGVRAPRVSADSKAEAQRLEAEFRHKLLAGVDPATLGPQPVQIGTTVAGHDATLAGAIDAAYKARWHGRKAELSSLRCAEAWATTLGRDFPLTGLTRDKIADVCDDWGAAGNSAGTINRKLAALSVMLKLAAEDGKIDRVPSLPKRKEYEGRLRYFSDAEVSSLLADAPDPEWASLFIIAVDTGLRQGELLTLIVRDVDLTGRRIDLGRTKGNQRRSVLLTAAATAAATRLVADKMDHERLFTTRLTPSNISRFMRAWKHRRGIPAGDEACFHTFRHTCCSRMVQRGVPLPVVQKWMGHADISTTIRYAHLAPDSLNQAVEALERNAA
jgi:integrase